MTNELRSAVPALSPEEERERRRRWRLVLGKKAKCLEGGASANGEEGNGSGGKGDGSGGKGDGSGDAERESSRSRSGGGTLTAEDVRIGKALESLYGDDDSRRGGDLSPSSPRVARWMGDVRKYFPQRVVEVLQKDAMDRVGIRGFLDQPEVLNTLTVDVNLVATLLSFSSAIPDETKTTARILTRKLVDDVVKRINAKTVAAVSGAIARSLRTNRPRNGEIDFNRTIMRNLKNWNADEKKLIVDKLAGYGRKRRSLYDVVLCVDQSGSMASSLVYSSILASVLGSIPAISTKLVFFDTSVVDMTSRVHDPVDVLFGAQLGGGTDIAQALEYCRSIITRPNKTFFALVSDLYEGNDVELMLDNLRRLVASGVKTTCLLALNDVGKPVYDRTTAAWCAALGAATFACTPDAFPELIAAVINGRDLFSWATSEGFAPIAPALSLPKGSADCEEE